jgi:putative redox protein
MAQAKAAPERYAATASNGRAELTANTLKNGVGGAEGFRPHELLESALAACMNMTVRMEADALGLTLRSVVTEVSIDRSEPGRAMFVWRLVIDGDVNDDNRRRLFDAAERCPVRQTLSRMLEFSSAS